MNKTLILRPKMSEKAYGLSEVSQTYVFEVLNSVNKQTIAEAVEAQFSVKVIRVRTTILKGKVKRSVRKSGRSVNGRRSDKKKAYITLKEGDKLPIFAAVEEAEEKARAAEARAAKRKK